MRNNYANVTELVSRNDIISGVRFACIDINLALAHMVCHFQGVARHDCCVANAENVRLDETMIIQ